MNRQRASTICHNVQTVLTERKERGIHLREIMQLCRETVEKIYTKYDASHDIHHIERVLVNAKRIMKTEQEVNPWLVELGVLLHDIDDPKYQGAGERTAQEILWSLGLEEEVVQIILQNIAAVSFSGGNEKELPSIEAAIMRDADRLDAIGAVGIARAFLFGGAKGHQMYNTKEVPRDEMTEAEYRTKEIAVVTHFHEKLLKVKQLMVTDEGKRLAEERHAFMEQFLRQLSYEIEER